MALSVYTPTGIVHETSVDFTKRVLAEPVHLVQYDASLPVLEVSVYDAGQYLTLTASDTVSIRMDKGDGTFIYNPALGMSADGHKVYVQITEQMTVNYGRFEPVLELLRGNGYGCSSPVPLFIDKNPVPNAAIESTDEFQTIQSMYNTVIGFSDALDYLNTPEAQTDVANAEENATAAVQSASAAAQSAENAAAAVDAVEFTQAATRENIVSGESLSTIMGKVKKWFADLKDAAFHAVAYNYTTQNAGYVLDARLGPAIKEKMDLADSLKSGLTYVDYTVTTSSEQYQGLYYADTDIASNLGTVVGIYMRGVSANKPAFPTQLTATRIRAFSYQASTVCTIRVLFKNY